MDKKLRGRGKGLLAEKEGNYRSICNCKKETRPSRGNDPTKNDPWKGC